MDEVVAVVDSFLVEPVYHGTVHDYLPERLDFWLAEGGVIRQIFCIYVILVLGGGLLYFLCSSLSYYIFFVHWKDVYHPASDPQPYSGQVVKEIRMTLWAIPKMAHLTWPFFLGEIRGYSKLYNSVYDNGHGWAYFCLSFLLIILWSDTLIYWIHKELHEISWAYKHIHKMHHAWKVPTPFAAIAFHPVDGWLQSLPYHFFPYIFPMQKWLSLGAFVFVQIWAVMIHDGAHLTPFSFVNGAAHHTFHHSKFIYNYGQFFTYWDRLCGTHMDPMAEYDKEKKQWISKN